MSDALKQAEQQLLEPGGLDQQQLEQVLCHLMGPAVDAGDLYFQSTAHESWVLEDGLVRTGTHAVEQGVGIRAISGEKTGFAYADEIVMPSLLQASGAARAIAREGRQGSVKAWRRRDASPLYSPADPMASMRRTKKLPCYARWMPMPVPAIRVSTRWSSAWLRLTRPFWWPPLMARWLPTCGRWCA